MPRNYPQGRCINSRQSGSEQFMLYLKSLGSSEADITGPACAVSYENELLRDNHDRAQLGIILIGVPLRGLKPC